MGFLDNMTRSLSRSVDNMGRSGKAAQLTLHLNQLESQRKELVAQLGASLYEETRNDPKFLSGRESLYQLIAQNDGERVILQAQIADLRYQQDARQTIACPHCGAPVSVGTKFCTICGKSINSEINVNGSGPQVPGTGKLCPVCGRPMAETDTFCMNCGTKYEEARVEMSLSGDGEQPGEGVDVSILTTDSDEVSGAAQPKRSGCDSDSTDRPTVDAGVLEPEQEGSVPSYTDNRVTASEDFANQEPALPDIISEDTVVLSTPDGLDVITTTDVPETAHLMSDDTKASVIETPNANVCPRCGASVYPQDNFCIRCGKSLKEED